jgi:hypothetical protein
LPSIISASELVLDIKANVKTPESAIFNTDYQTASIPIASVKETAGGYFFFACADYRLSRRRAAVDSHEQISHPWPITRIFTAMSEENISVAVEHEVAAGLVNILFAVIAALQAFAHELKIQLERRR